MIRHRVVKYYDAASSYGFIIFRSDSRARFRGEQPGLFLGRQVQRTAFWL